MKIDRSKMKYLDKFIDSTEKGLRGVSATVSASPWSTSRGTVGYTLYVRASGIPGDTGEWAISIAIVDGHGSWFWVFNRDAVALLETGEEIHGCIGDYRSVKIRFAANEAAKRIKEFVVAAAMMK